MFGVTTCKLSRLDALCLQKQKGDGTLKKILASIAGMAMPAMAADRAVVTPSGQPDAMFRGSSTADAASKIANSCMNQGWQVTEQSPTQVTCEVHVSAMKSALQQVLLGNAYSTTPRTFIRVSIAAVGDNARAQAIAWTETQMAFGQTRQNQYSDNATFNNLEGFLIKAGGELPPGTHFAGIFLGFAGEPQMNGNEVAIPVTSVVAGGPGAAAGLRPGDQITEVNGARFKNMEDFHKHLNKIGVGNRFPITIVRNGQKLTLHPIAATRPPVGTPEYEALVAAAKVPSAAPGLSTTGGAAIPSDPATPLP
jgi:hypothetical protein